MNKSSLVIATRQSPLALWQAEWVQQRLQQLYPDLTVSLLGITTVADNMLSTSLQQIGGKGLFVKELEEALLDGRADIAVHSMKDVPMDLPHGLILPVICEREDPRDAFVANDYQTLFDLPRGAKVGTSSLRRQCQLRALRPDLEVIHLRGNVNTRLLRLDAGEFAAIILAAAGLKRLGLDDRLRSLLSIEQSLPAAGQGVLGIECREDDIDTQKRIAPLNDIHSSVCVTAERALCKRLGGSCQVPIGAFAEVVNDKIKLRGLVGRPDGTTLLRAEAIAEFNNMQALGVGVAEELIQQGANQILNALAGQYGK